MTLRRHLLIAAFVVVMMMDDSSNVDGQSSAAETSTTPLGPTNSPACGSALINGKPVLSLICEQNTSTTPPEHTFPVTASVLLDWPELTLSCEVRRPGNTANNVELKKMNKTTGILESLVPQRREPVRSRDAIPTTRPHCLRTRNYWRQDTYVCVLHQSDSTGRLIETVLGSVKFRYDFPEAFPASLPTQLTVTASTNTIRPCPVTVATEASTTPSTATKEKNGSKGGLSAEQSVIIVLAALLGAALVAIVVIVICLFRRRQRRGQDKAGTGSGSITGNGSAG